MDLEKTGMFLASLRKTKGYTQQEVADILNISNKTVSKWEQGGGYPEITMLPVLSELYEITVDELLAGERKIKEGQTIEQKVHERKKYLLTSIETRFNIFYIAAIIMAIMGYIDGHILSLSYITLVYVPEILGLIVLLVGITYATTPLRNSIEMFDAGELFDLKHTMYIKQYLFAAAFVFAIEPLFGSYFVTMIIIAVFLSALWLVLQKRLHDLKKEGLLFPKVMSFVLLALMLIMIIVRILDYINIKNSIDNNIYTDNLKFYEIFGHHNTAGGFAVYGLQICIILIVAVNVLKENKKTSPIGTKH